PRGSASPDRAAIHDPDRLALRALELAELRKADLRGERQEVGELATDPRADGGIAAGLGFDVDRQALAPALPVEHDLVLVAHAGLAQQDGLDLARVEVDTLEDHHVVGPAAQPVEPERRPPAVALGAREHAREVAGAVADEGQPDARERRDDQLALGAVRDDGAGRGVHDFGMGVVLPDVDPRARRAVDPHAGTAGLGHADDVEAPDRELALDAAA